ncbi:MAG: hypothetical protein KGY76_08120 [Candidatus Thermoplasmatota archaeon]|nr:hypothetical protein [Candidatus Thermoplasmatota archaeon]
MATHLEDILEAEIPQRDSEKDEVGMKRDQIALWEESSTYGKNTSQQIIEYLTELELQAKAIERRFDIDLPVSETVIGIEQNIGKRSAHQLLSKIDDIENLLEQIQKLLRADPKETELEDIIDSSEDLEEVKDGIDEEIYELAQEFEDYLSYCERLGLNTKNLVEKKNMAFNWMEDSEYKKALDNLREGIKLAFDSTVEKVEEFKEEVQRRKEEGVRVKRAEEDLESIQGSLDKRKLEATLQRSIELKDRLIELDDAHERFVEELSNIRSDVEELESKGLDVGDMKEKINDIQELDDTYEEKIERLSEIKEHLRAREEDSLSVVQRMEYMSNKNPFLSNLISRSGILERMKELNERDKWGGLQELGPKHHDRLESLNSRYEELRDLEKEVNSDLLNLKETAGVDTTNLAQVNESERIASMLREVDLQAANFDYHSKLADLFESWEEALESLRENYKEIEEKIEVLDEEREEEIEKALSRLEFIGEEDGWLDDKVEKVEQIRKTLEREVKDRREELYSEIEELKEKNKKAINKGIRTQLVNNEFHSKAENLIEKDEFEEAVKVIRDFDETLQRKIEGHNKIVVKFEELKEKLKEGQEYGMDIQKYQDRLPSLKKITDYEETLDEIKVLEREIEEVRSRKIEEAEEKLSNVKKKISSFEGRDISIGNLNREINKMETYIDEGSLGAAFSIYKEIQEKIRLQEKLFKKIKRLEEDLNEAKKLELDISKIENELKEIDQAEDLSEGLNKVKSLHKELMTTFEKERGRFETKLSELEEKYQVYMDKGALLETDLKGIPERARKALDEGNLQEMIDSFSEFEKKLQEGFENYKEFMKKVSKFKTKLDESESYGIDTRYFEKQIVDPKSLEDYERGYSKIEELESELEEKKKEKIEEAEEKVDQIKDQIEKIRSEGLKPEGLIEQKNKIREKINRGDLVGASSVYERALDEIKEIEKKKEKVQEKREELEDEIKRAQKVGIDVNEIRRRLEENRRDETPKEKIKTLTEIDSKLQNKFENKKEEIKKDLEKLSDKHQKTLEKGIMLDITIDGMPTEVKQNLENDDLLRAEENLNEFKEKLKEAIQKYEVFIANRNKILSLLDSLEVDEEKRKELLQSVPEPEEVIDYDAALEQLQGVRKKIKMEESEPPPT